MRASRQTARSHWHNVGAQIAANGWDVQTTLSALRPEATGPRTWIMEGYERQMRRQVQSLVKDYITKT